MLQPNGHRSPYPAFAKRIWIALTFSMFLYVFVLFQVGKITGLWIPEGITSPYDFLVPASFVALFVSFRIFQKKVQHEANFQAKFPFMIINWALNETPVLAAFAATFVGASGNGIYLLVTVVPALLMNLKMFPR